MASDDVTGALGLLKATPALARMTIVAGATRQLAEDSFLPAIEYYIYPL